MGAVVTSGLFVGSVVKTVVVSGEFVGPAVLLHCVLCSVVGGWVVGIAVVVTIVVLKGGVVGKKLPAFHCS